MRQWVVTVQVPLQRSTCRRRNSRRHGRVSRAVAYLWPGVMGSWAHRGPFVANLPHGSGPSRRVQRAGLRKNPCASAREAGRVC